MSTGSIWQRVVRFLASPHGDVKSFEQEVEAAGVVGRSEGGMRTIPVRKVVGSVGRAQNLRSDFFYKTGKAITTRYLSIGRAMQEGKILPPIEVYRAKLRRAQKTEARDMTEYYVVDGHHRVAMAKKLGQDYLDAHVVEYKVASAAARPPGPAAPPQEQGPGGAGVADQN